MEEKRLLLACDDAKGVLGDVALQLVRVGADTVYAPDLAEAELMARQEGRRIGGILVPSDITPDRLHDVLEHVALHTRVTLDDFALLGRRPSDRQVEILRDLGVPWRLWAPYSDRDLRFLHWVMVWAGTDDDLRIDPRLPTALPAHVVRRGEEREILVGDLSRSGAYLETSSPFPAGSQVHLSISLPAGVVEFFGVVRWVSPEIATPTRARPAGFGVEFLEIPDGSLRAVVDHLMGERDRFAL